MIKAITYFFTPYTLYTIVLKVIDPNNDTNKPGIHTFDTSPKMQSDYTNSIIENILSKDVKEPAYY